MKQIILVLAAIAVIQAGSYKRASQIYLQGGRDNVLNFACGGADASGSINLLNEDYTYNFFGLPSWMSARGSSIFGRPPANQKGPWRVRVDYSNSRRRGSNYINLNIASGNRNSRGSRGSGSGSSGLSDYFYFTQGGLGGNRNIITSSAGNYVLLVPFFGSSGASISANSLNQLSISGSSAGSFSTANNGFFSGLKVDCSSYESNLAAAQRAKADAQAQSNTLLGQYNTAKASVDSLKLRFTELQNQAGSTGTASIDAQINQLNARIDTLRVQVMSQKAASDVSANQINVARQLVQAAKAAKQSVDSMRREAETNGRARLSQAQNDWNSAKARASEVEQSLRRAQSDYESSNGNAAKAKYDEATANVQRLRAELAAAERAQAAAQAEYQQASQNSANARSKVDEWTQRLTAAQAEVANGQQQYQAAEAALSGINFQAELSKADSDLKNAQDQVDEASRKNKSIRQRYEQIKATYQSTITQLSGLQATRAQKLNQAGGIRAQLSQVSLELNRAVGTYNELAIKLSTFKSRIGMYDGVIQGWTLQLQACRTSANWGFIASDWTCGSNPWGSMNSFERRSGTGAVRYIGPDYIMVDGTKIFLGSCSKSIFRSGSNAFNIGDMVEYDAIPRNGKVWGRRVVCRG